MDKAPHYDPNKWLLDNPNDLISIKKWQRTVDLLAKLFDAPAGFLVQYTPAGFQVTISSDQDSNPYPAGVVIEPEVNIFCRRIVETGKQLYVPNAPIDPCWDTNPEVHNDGFKSYLGVPVYWPNGQAFGTFCVMDYRETDYGETYFELIQQLKDILESDLSLLEMYQQVQELAVTDSLTDINNRRGFTILAKQRLHIAKRIESSLGLFYFDIDQFKFINDEFGHGVGDEVLKKVSLALQLSTRNADVIGRMGGDEFVALVSIKHDGDQDKILDRFKQSIAKLQTDDKQPRFSVSSGFTKLDLESGIEDLLDIADKAMLAKKKCNH